jgi:hypothetical protein
MERGEMESRNTVPRDKLEWALSLSVHMIPRRDGTPQYTLCYLAGLYSLSQWTFFVTTQQKRSKILKKHDNWKSAREQSRDRQNFAS